MGKLLMRTEGVLPAQIELREGANRIGRGPDNEFVISDPSVSTFHCVVTLSNGTVTVQDVGSTNGTYIDGQPIQEATLVHGQILRLGQVELSCWQDAPAGFAVRMVSASATGPEPAKPAGLRLASNKPVAAAEVQAVEPPVEAGLRVAHQSAPPPVPTEGVPPVANPCKHHPHVAAELVCKQCGAQYCRECVDEQKVGKRLWRLCPVCKGECVSLEDKRAADEQRLARESRTFFQELPGIFKYPFSQGGTLLLICGTLLYLMLDVIQFIVKFAGLFGFVALAFVCIGGYGYLFAFMQRIIVTSAQGQDSLPDWPDLSEGWSDVARPFFMMVFTFAICFAPALGYLIFSPGAEEDMNPTILFPLVGLGFLYFPMALLAVAMADTCFAVNPLVVVPAITKMPLAYLIACVVFFVIVAVRYASVSVLATLLQSRMLCSIPAGFLALYFLTVEMRLLGMMYYKNREQIGWFRKT